MSKCLNALIKKRTHGHCALVRALCRLSVGVYNKIMWGGPLLPPLLFSASPHTHTHTHTRTHLNPLPPAPAREKKTSRP